MKTFDSAMEKMKEKAYKRKSRTEDADDGNSQESDERRSSRVKKPKVVYDPSDASAPYKKINLEELTKSPSKKSLEAVVVPKPIAIKVGPPNFENRNCKVCSQPLEGVPSVVCVVCDDSYHCYCHEPRVGKTTRKATWRCIECRPKDEPSLTPTGLKRVDGKEQRESTSERSSNTVKSENASEVDEFEGFEEETRKNGKEGSNGIVEYLQDDSGKFLKINLAKARQLFKISSNTMPNKATIPDCRAWECSEVFDYFQKIFPKEAHIFRDEEIDGTSLMLMTRSDMLKFSLKLGPALNIYRHIVMLQSRSLDPRKTWK